jgi:predicted small metal-binding protein
MKYVIQCPCGVTVVADSPVALIDEVCAHAAQAHGMSLTRDQASEMISIVGTDRGRPAPGTRPK